MFCIQVPSHIYNTSLCNRYDIYMYIYRAVSRLSSALIFQLDQHALQLCSAVPALRCAPLWQSGLFGSPPGRLHPFSRLIFLISFILLLPALSFLSCYCVSLHTYPFCLIDFVSFPPYPFHLIFFVSSPLYFFSQLFCCFPALLFLFDLFCFFLGPKLLRLTPNPPLAPTTPPNFRSPF